MDVAPFVGDVRAPRAVEPCACSGGGPRPWDRPAPQPACWVARLFRLARARPEAEGDAFIDGPELDISRPPRLPDAGTATYVGGAGGFFRYRYGSDWTGVEAPVDVEEFTGTIAITADFADQTVRGCIGCVGALELDREHLYGVLGFRRRDFVREGRAWRGCTSHL